MPDNPAHPSWLAPAGPAAAEIAGISWVLFAVCGLVLLAVLAALALAVRRRPPLRQSDPPDEFAVRDGMATWWIGAGAVATVLVLALFHALGLRAFARVLPPADSALTVEVVGHQWWWAVRYVGEPGAPPVDTANEIRIPVGQRVAVHLLASDVIHSFWVPQLQGKLDLIPGKRNVTWIQADRPGVYRGFCAEFCGLQHATMTLLVIAEPPEVFAQSLRRERAPAETPKDEMAARGQRLFIDRGCAQCHAIRGTAALGRLGPDLTHLASRQTLAAGTLTNVPGHLAGWIANPQALKPGNRMPAAPLAPGELHAIVHYLRGLW